MTEGEVVVVVAHLGVLRLFTRADASDAGALGLLKKVWLAPNGTTVDFKR